MFPFYRTEITQFELKLNKIPQPDEMRVNEYNTFFIKVEDVKKAYCITPAWIQLWLNVESLLESFMFKELVMTTTINKGMDYKFNEK